MKKYILGLITFIGCAQYMIAMDRLPRTPEGVPTVFIPHTPTGTRRLNLPSLSPTIPTITSSSSPQSLFASDANNNLPSPPSPLQFNQATRSSRLKRNREVSNAHSLKTLWFSAIKSGTFDLIKEYNKQFNIRVNWQDADKRTALHYACQNNNTVLTKYLLDQDADPDIKDNTGKTAFDSIPVFSSKPIINLFFNSGKITEQKKSTFTKNILALAPAINTPKSTLASQSLSETLEIVAPSTSNAGLLSAAYKLNIPGMNPDLKKVAQKIITQAQQNKLPNCPICMDPINENDKHGIIRFDCCAQPTHATCFNDYYTANKNKTNLNCPACATPLMNPQENNEKKRRTLQSTTQPDNCVYCDKPCLKQIQLAHTNSEPTRIHQDCLEKFLLNRKSLSNPYQKPLDSESDSDEDDFENEFAPLQQDSGSDSDNDE